MTPQLPEQTQPQLHAASEKKSVPAKATTEMFAKYEHIKTAYAVLANKREEFDTYVRMVRQGLGIADGDESWMLTEDGTAFVKVTGATLQLGPANVATAQSADTPPTTKKNNDHEADGS